MHFLLLRSPLLACLWLSPVVVGPASSRSTQAGSRQPMDQFTVYCDESIRDQATSSCLTASSTPILGSLYPLSANLCVGGSGNVGIGTSSPAYKLDVAGQANVGQSALSYTMNVANSATSGIRDGLRAQAHSGSSYTLWAVNNATTSTAYAVRAQSDSTTGRACFGEATTTGATVAYGMFGECHNATAFGVYSSGDFGGTGAKYFIQPHPTDPSKQIHFACLEGNESGTYFRGSIRIQRGVAEIDVPESFRLVTEEGSLTATATAVGAPALVWIETQSLERIVVRANADVTVNYVVNGVRRGFAGLETIRENTSFVPEYRGLPFGLQYRPEYRKLLVDNGILNADFTPNEETARRLGRTLVDPWDDEHAEPLVREMIRAGLVTPPAGWIPPSAR